MYSSLTNFMKMVLTSMMGGIALPSILSKIVGDHGNDEFGDFKFIIVEILDTYSFERAILHTANRLIERDMHEATRNLFHKRAKGYRVKPTSCGLCSHPLNPLKSAQTIKSNSNNNNNSNNDPNASVIFFCGHSFHKQCIRASSSSSSTDSDNNNNNSTRTNSKNNNEQMFCPLCSTKKENK